MSVAEILKDLPQVPEPLHRWQPNAKCLCGSGVKFKKCHKPQLPRFTDINHAVQSEVLLQEAKKKGLTW